jgi:hypothetical protein
MQLQQEIHFHLIAPLAIHENPTSVIFLRMFLEVGSQDLIVGS